MSVRCFDLAALCVTTLLCVPCLGQQSPTPARGYVLPDGVVRIIGAPETEGIVQALNVLFEQSHPGLHLKFEKSNTLGSIDSLIFDATLIAPVVTPYGGGIAYSDIVKATPFSIRIAHASVSPTAALSPLAVIVNPVNPMDKISMDQLASIFSKPLRSPVFSYWRQLNVAGPLLLQPVSPAGLPWTDHYTSDDPAFGDDVFLRRFNGAAPADTYRMFQTYGEVAAFVAANPAAIGIVALNQITPGVKLLGITDGPLAKVRIPSAADIRSGHYPLDRYIYLYARVPKGKQMDALAFAYLQLALSPAGQAAIAAEHEGYLPLNPTEVSEEQSKFE